MSRRYAESPNGPVQRAFRLRLSGMAYAQIVERLKLEFAQECADLNWDTVRKWAMSGRLHWDEIRLIADEARIEDMPAAARPQDAERLKQVRMCLDQLARMFDPDETPDKTFVDRVKELGVRPDTWQAKLLAEERQLSRSDLVGIPKAAQQRAFLLIAKELIGELVDRRLVSADRMIKEAAAIEAAIIRRLPGLFRKVMAEDAVGGGASDE